MFTKDDYINYFNELEAILKEALVIYTDLLNDIGDQAISSKLSAVASESMEAFKFVKAQKEKFV